MASAGLVSPKAVVLIGSRPSAKTAMRLSKVDATFGNGAKHHLALATTKVDAAMDVAITRV